MVREVSDSPAHERRVTNLYGDADKSSALRLLSFSRELSRGIGGISLCGLSAHHFVKDVIIIVIDGVIADISLPAIALMRIDNEVMAAIKASPVAGCGGGGGDAGGRRKLLRRFCRWDTFFEKM